MTSPHPSLVELRTKVDSLTARILRMHGDSIACRPGCAECCRADLTIFPVEAEPIRIALADLPPHLLEAVHERCRNQSHCIFLLEERCVVYDQRPLICRTQGLPLQIAADRRTACHLNFTPAGSLQELHPENVLNLNTLNTLLSLLHQLHIGPTGDPDRRVRLAELPETQTDLT